jgi:hypothetical protein
MKSTLIFGRGNAKLDGFIATFSLPAGHSCPFADVCLSRCVSCGDSFKVQDGPACQFRCFAAGDEAKYPTVRNARNHNFTLLRNCKTVNEMADLICNSLPKAKKVRAIRAHVAGDFFSQTYFDAWLEVARRCPNLLFYAYTKSIPFWVNRLKQIPINFKLNASFGGKANNLIKLHNLKSATVVFSVAEAQALGLEIDHDDSHAYGDKGNFALLLHGTQPKDTPAAGALKILRKLGIGGFVQKKATRVKAA